jgi:SAM-dependent methyltransferase
MMDALQDHDVPYGDDWDNAATVLAWAEAADRKRPWRSQIRDRIAARVAMLAPKSRVLELGSGPGFLAQRVLQRCGHLESYTLLDFSESMLAMSQERLAAFPAASFVLASFRAPRLYEQIYQVLTVPGSIMICDHTPFDDSPSSTALYMTGQQQQEALLASRFTDVRVELSINGLVLYTGERTA